MADAWWAPIVQAGGALTSGVLGGYFGALWQRRNSDGLLSRQFEENERVRQGAAAEAATAREQQLKHDRAMRLLNDKRALYSRYLQVLDDYRDARAEEQALDQQVDALEAAGVTADADTGEAFRRYTEILRAHADALTRCRDLSTEFVKLSYELLFIAPGHLGNTALKLDEAMREGRDEEASKLWSKFLEGARADLNV